MKRLIFAAAALAAFATGAAQGKAYLVTIPLRGVDLATDAGADTTRQRAREAATLICGEMISPTEIVAHMRCRAPFLEAAERKIVRANARATPMASR